MICPECRYEYTSQEAINKSVCPACKTNFIIAIIDLANPYNALNKLRDAIYYLGDECLNDKELLIKLVNGLYQDEKELLKLFLISINENLNYKMYNLLKAYDRSNELELIESKLVSDAYLSESASKKIIEYWCYVLDFDENEETIRLIENGNYVNSKGELLCNLWRGDLTFSEGLACVNNSYFINFRGEIIIDLKATIYPKFGWGIFDDVLFKEFHDGLSLFSYRGKCGFFDMNANVILKLEDYNEVLSFSEGLCALSLNGLWGFIDKSGNEKIKHKYEKVHSFSEGLAPVYANDNWTFIDYNGKIKLSLKKYIDVEPFFNGLAKVKNDKVGFIDKEGNEVINTKYDDAIHFYKENDLIAVKCEKWGVINKKDEVIIPFEFDEIGLINKSLFMVTKENIVINDKTVIAHGLYRSDGVKLFDVMYADIKQLDLDIILLREISVENTYLTIPKLYNINENVIYDIDDTYSVIHPFVNGLAMATNPRSYGFEWVFYIDKCGNTIISNIKDGSDINNDGYLVGGESFYDGYAAVSNNIQHHKAHYSEFTSEGETYEYSEGGGEYRLWSVINLKGNLVCKVKFKEICSLRCREFSASLDNRRSVEKLNKKGRWLYSEDNEIENSSINIFYKYDKVGVLSEGLLAVKYDGKWGYVDIDNKKIIPLIYSYASEFHNGIAKVREFREEKYPKSGWALINSKGNHITPFKYSNIEDYGEEYYKVSQYNEELRRYTIGLIDKNGNIHIPIIYDDIKIRKYFNGLYCVKKEKKWGFINNEGKVIIDFLYSEIGYESNGLVLFYNDGFSTNNSEDIWFGLVNINGKEIAKGFRGIGFMKFKDYDGDSKIYKLNSLSDYKKSISRWDYEKERYDLDDFWKCNFFNGLTIYFKDYKYGFINEHGNILTKNCNNLSESYKSCQEPILYDDIYKPKNGLFKVELNNRYGCVDLDGFEIIECIYSTIKILPEGYVEASLQVFEDKQQKYKHGLFNLKGEVIIPIEYDELSSFNNGIIIGKKNGIKYEIDTIGTIIKVVNSTT